MTRRVYQNFDAPSFIYLRKNYNNLLTFTGHCGDWDSCSNVDDGDEHPAETKRLEIDAFVCLVRPDENTFATDSHCKRLSNKFGQSLFIV